MKRRVYLFVGTSCRLLHRNDWILRYFTLFTDMSQKELKVIGRKTQISSKNSPPLLWLDFFLISIRGLVASSYSSSVTRKTWGTSAREVLLKHWKYLYKYSNHLTYFLLIQYPSTNNNIVLNLQRKIAFWE